MTDSMLTSLPDEEIYRRCFEDSTDGMIVTDLAGRIVRANRAWLEMYGFTEAEVLGQTTRLVRSPTSTNEVYQAMWSAIADPARGFWKGELVNRRKDGVEIPVLVTITPVRQGERIVGYMGISLDARERHELEELKRLYELVVWHDLRSPLSALRTLLDVMPLSGPLTEEQKDLLARAVRQAGRMSELIAVTLDLEKLKERKLQLEIRDVDLVPLARESLQSLSERAAQMHVAAHLSGDRLVARADPLHVQRCFDNLIKNAIEASPHDGVVEVGLARAGERARLSVHNGGRPIPVEVRATLFHPFGTYGKRGGTGLGLYGVKLLAEAMGGAVCCQTGESGTTFELLLPLGNALADPSVV